MSFIQRKQNNCTDDSTNVKPQGVIINMQGGAVWTCAGCKLHCVPGAQKSDSHNLYIPSINATAMSNYVDSQKRRQPMPQFGTAAAAVEFAKQVMRMCDNYRVR